MENYEAVHQWAATVNVSKALQEIEGLKARYPWLKCDETLAALRKMNEDLPKIIHIIKFQEKQNAIHQRVIDVNHLADEAIVKAVMARHGL